MRPPKAAAPSPGDEAEDGPGGVGAHAREQRRRQYGTENGEPPARDHPAARLEGLPKPDSPVQREGIAMLYDTSR